MKRTLLAFVTTLLPMSTATATPCVNYGESLHIDSSIDTGSDSHAIAVAGDWAYVTGPAVFPSRAGMLTVIDLANPDSPSIAGSIETPSIAHDIFVDGLLVYAVEPGFGLRILDVSNPAAPAIVTSLTTPGDAEAVIVEGGYAYVADGFAGIQIVDVSDPESPTITSEIRTTDATLTVTVDSGVLYAGEAHTGLRIFDLTDPTAPAEMGAIASLGNATEVAVAGSTAHVIYDSGRLELVDVSNPAMPFALGFAPVDFRANAVAVSGNHALVSNGPTGLRVINIADASSPTVLTDVDTPGRSTDLVLAGTRVYLSGEDGVQVIDVTNVAGSSLIGSMDTPGYARDVAISGDLAYVADDSDGLRIFDVSDPSQPASVGSVNLDDYRAWSVAVSDTYAYVASWALDVDGAFHVVDIRDPTNPTIAGSVETPSRAHDVVLSQGQFFAGSYAFVATRHSGLEVIHILYPEQPERVFQMPTFGKTGVAVRGDTLVMVSGHSISVWNVSFPWIPRFQGGTTLSLPSGSGSELRRLAIAGDFAYVTSTRQGLQVVDISDPGSPRWVGLYPTPDSPVDVTVVGDLAYVADSWSGVQLIDVTAPFSQGSVGTLTTPGIALGIDVSSELVLVADHSAGLQLAPVHCQTSVPVLLTAFAVESDASATTIHWELATVVAVEDLRIEATEHSRAWTVPVQRQETRYRARDGSPERRSSSTITYRLLHREEERWNVLAEQAVTVPSLGRDQLVGVHPNPFNPRTKISFRLERAARVVVSVHDLTGRRVRTLEDRDFETGVHTTQWLGRDDTNAEVASGSYVIRMSSGGKVDSRTVTLLR